MNKENLKPTRKGVNSFNSITESLESSVTLGGNMGSGSTIVESKEQTQYVRDNLDRQYISTETIDPIIDEIEILPPPPPPKLPVNPVSDSQGIETPSNETLTPTVEKSNVLGILLLIGLLVAAIYFLKK